MKLPMIDEVRKKIIFNYLSLMSLQGINYILPLILMPYLVIRLGLENFGLLTYITTIFLIYGFFLDYGFNLSASRDISANISNKIRINEIFLSVYLIKFLIILVSIIILIFFLTSGFFEVKNSRLIICCFISATIQFLLPTFLLIGIEKMGALSIINIIMKFFSALLIFIFIAEAKDILLVPIIYSIGGLIALIYSAIYIGKLHIIDLKIYLNKYIVIDCFNKGFPIFIAIISSNVIYYSPILMLGYLETKVAVGVYTVADTVMRAIRNIIYPAASAILPHSTRIAKIDIKSSLNFNLKIAISFSVILIVLCLFFYVYSTPIIEFFVKKDIDKIHEIRLYFVMLLIFVPLHPLIHIFATQSILNLNLTKAYAYIFFIIGCLSLLTTFIFIKLFSIKGAIISYGIIEFLLCISLVACILYYFRFRKTE